MKQSNCVIFDVETTGLSAKLGDRIIEIAALKLENLKVVKSFSTLVNPQCAISYEAFQVHRISQEMLGGAPLIKDVLPDVLEFIKGSIIIGHNIKFDISFLTNELDLSGHIFYDEFIPSTSRRADDFFSAGLQASLCAD